MALTARLWVSGELNTAAKMNTIRTDLLELQGLQGLLETVTPTILPGGTQTNNWSIGSTRSAYVRATAGSGGGDVRGIVAKTAGTEYLIRTFPSNAITYRHDSASASAGNKILTTTGADIVSPVNGMVRAVYDGTLAYWMLGAMA